MKLLRSGVWWMESGKDLRWNASGPAMVGSFTRPREIDEEIARLTKLLGEPPGDLAWGYDKD